MPAVPLTDSKSIKILVCAPSGWGKTRLAGTSPGKPNLFIRPPVDYTDSVLAADKKRWLQWIVRDWSGMEDVFEHLRHEGDKYNWVWFDSISAYQDIGLDDLWETIITENPGASAMVSTRATTGSTCSAWGAGCATWRRSRHRGFQFRHHGLACRAIAKPGGQ
jgi:hypothetical protein